MTKIQKWQITKNISDRVYMQDCMLRNQYIAKYVSKKHGTEEHVLKSDFVTAINRNSYYVRRILYQLNLLLDEFLSASVEKLPEENFSGQVGYSGNASFNLDAFLYASGALVEEPFFSGLEKYLTKIKKKKELLLIKPQRKDPTGLYWRINMMRNRAVHIDDNYYTKDFGLLSEFSSHFAAIIYEEGNIDKIQTTLIDPKNIPELKQVIESVISDRRKNIMSEIFGNKKPKGALKKNQNIKWFSNGFELVSGLPDIAECILAVLEDYHVFCAKWFLETTEVENVKYINGGRNWSRGQIFPTLF